MYILVHTCVNFGGGLDGGAEESLLVKYDDAWTRFVIHSISACLSLVSRSDQNKIHDMLRCCNQTDIPIFDDGTTGPSPPS